MAGSPSRAKSWLDNPSPRERFFPNCSTEGPAAPEVAKNWAGCVASASTCSGSRSRDIGRSSSSSRAPGENRASDLSDSRVGSPSAIQRRSCVQHLDLGCHPLVPLPDKRRAHIRSLLEIGESGAFPVVGDLRVVARLQPVLESASVPDDQSIRLGPLQLAGDPVLAGVRCRLTSVQRGGIAAFPGGEGLRRVPELLSHLRSGELQHLLAMALSIALDRLDLGRGVELWGCLDRGLDRLLARRQRKPEQEKPRPVGNLARSLQHSTKVRSGSRRGRSRGPVRPLAQLSGAPWLIQASSLLNSHGAITLREFGSSGMRSKHFVAASDVLRQIMLFIGSLGLTLTTFGAAALQSGDVG